MKHKDIWIAESYKVKGAYGRGPATVAGPSRRQRYGTNFEWPVVFNQMRPGVSGSREAWIPSRDFVKRWTDEDQEQFESATQEGARLDAIRTALLAAGYEATVRTVNGLFINFQGDDAERVVETLLKAAGEDYARTRKQLAQSKED